MSAPKPSPIRWCKASPGGLHPATHPRTGLCDLHHAEYQRAHAAWRQRVAYHGKHPTSDDPGTWEGARARIDYTPVDEVYTALTPEDRAALRLMASKVEGLLGFFPRFTTGEAYFDTSEADFRTLLGYLETNVADALILMRRIGQDPE